MSLGVPMGVSPLNACACNFHSFGWPAAMRSFSFCAAYAE
jgi:hypothetical protein